MIFSHAAGKFFLTGGSMNSNIPITAEKKYFKTWQRFFHNKRIYPVLSIDYSHRNISFFFYENFCTDRNLLTRKFNIGHTSIPDYDHLGG